MRVLNSLKSPLSMCGKETFVKGRRFVEFNLQSISLGRLFKGDPIGPKCEKIDNTWVMNKFQILRRTPSKFSC